LGHYPEYEEFAKALGARHFSVPKWVWDRMSDAERWAANVKFLDRMIARGDEIILATRADLARAGSDFAKELKYLVESGFKISKDGFRCTKP